MFETKIEEVTALDPSKEVITLIKSILKQNETILKTNAELLKRLYSAPIVVNVKNK